MPTTKKVQVRLAVPDCHFPFEDKAGIRKLLEFTKHLKPDGVDIIGDVIDCVAPSTKVLTYDLRWVPAGDLQPEDVLIGFDESSPGMTRTGGRRKQRCLRKSVVLKTRRVQRPCIRLTFGSGETMVASKGHPMLAWLSTKNRATLVWITVEEITKRVREGRPILLHRPIKPWESKQSTYTHGLLRAAFDGEGYVTFNLKANNFGHLGFSQKVNTFLGEVTQALKEEGFDPQLVKSPDKSAAALNVGGGFWEMARFIGQYRPSRFVKKWVDKAPVDGYALSSPYRERIVSVEDVGEQTVIALETSTKTLFTDGFSSHNCYTLSRFDKNPARKHTFQNELDEARTFLEALREACPKADIRYSEGNHEQRHTRRLWGPCREYADLRGLSIPTLLGLDDSNKELPSLRIAYHKTGNPYRIGSMWYMHGEVIRKHGGSTARTTSDRISGSVIVGHSHRMGWVPTASWAGCRDAYEIGHLSDYRKLDYVSGLPQWQSGWAVAYIGQKWHDVSFCRQVVHPGRHGTSYIFQGNTL